MMNKRREDVGEKIDFKGLVNRMRVIKMAMSGKIEAEFGKERVGGRGEEERKEGLGSGD
jgi:hypothetical protein